MKNCLSRNYCSFQSACAGKERVFAWGLCMLLVLTAGLGAARGGEQLYGEFSDYLVNIEGWQAVSSSEINAAVGKIKMINAIRTYIREEMVIKAAIIIASRELTVRQFRDMDNSVDMCEISVLNIGGFMVYQFYERQENAGAVSVLLADGESLGSVFTLSYTGISKEDALLITRQFDWQRMKEVVGKYM